MLYLVSTPIGNLADFSYRAVSILSESDTILAEDTRTSAVLLNHYKIKKPLKSYHKFNEQERIQEVLLDLARGKRISLISDAGTPGIADPGEILVRAVRDAGFSVYAVPGASALLAALVTSGLATSRFQFMGFLPKKKEERINSLKEALLYPGTSIFYETANRLLATLKELHNLDPSRTIAIARELTKKFEEHKKGSAAELIQHFENSTLKGEIVLLIEQGENHEDPFSHLSFEEHVTHLEKHYQMSSKEAIKMVAKLRGIGKRDLYSKIHKN